MIPQDFLKTIGTEHNVSDTELDTLSLALKGESINAIATRLDITPEAVRKRLGEVYKKFGIRGAGPGKLAKLQQILVNSYQKEQNTTILAEESSQDEGEEAIVTPRHDLSQAPDVSIFYGRGEDLATLQQWIVPENCRVVVLLGMAGIGKTALSVKLARGLKDEFDCVIWRSLRRAPQVEDFLDDLLKCFSRHRANLRGDRDDKINQLLKYLKQYRCLIVLDNLETLHRTEDFAGQFEEKHKGYGELLMRLGEKEAHNSCIVITSLDKPRELSRIEGKRLPVRFYQMTGLNEVDAAEIFKSKDLLYPQHWKHLTEIYGGNPLALKMVANTIGELFQGSVADFLSQDVTIVQDVSDLIEQQFERLLPIEKAIANWMAVVEHPISIPDLKDYILLAESDRNLLDALESLARRSLIEKNLGGFTLPPIVMEYVKNQLLDGAVDELSRAIRTAKLDKLDILKNYRLPIDDELENEAQEKPTKLIDKIVERLCKVRSKTTLKEQLKIFSNVQEQKREEMGYALDNFQDLILKIEAN